MLCKKLFGDGFALTGNASEFLDPVFSSGMAFATESGMLAAKLALRQLNGENRLAKGIYRLYFIWCRCFHHLCKGMVHRKSSGIIFPPPGKSGCKEKYVLF
jgi:hypothetical protein